MNRRKKCPEEVSERWAIPYADFLTLLLCLFIALFAMAQAGKQAALEYAQAFARAFGMRLVPYQETLPRQILPQPVPPKVRPTEKGQKILKQIMELEKTLKTIGLEGKLKVAYEAIGIRLILQERLLFDSGSADIKPQFYPILDKIAELLNSIPNPVEVEGHTDNIPISTGRFPSNWELSTARASSVVRYFIAKGVSPDRLKASGYADTRPIASNATPEGREQNRRVEIVIINIKGYELTEPAP
ncbi:OmpA/MotB domain protein [Thermocrinis albus DSM 14484]|uniref:OmpA/MotB domain protein n=1 Tax=Thermocrinis albus (strain DSM 14484 / JCM 11386 / HI 11/12) TaxID=638303 RepID=D3SLD7_THEAH|nr:flagellar motor protein MotB [Thermocrinis albus]ADC89567.1 OmpA/MotB domain protein [Thermocrinis albus DSM 14484]